MTAGFMWWMCHCGQRFETLDHVTSCPSCGRAFVTVTNEDRDHYKTARKQRRGGQR